MGLRARSWIPSEGRPRSATGCGPSSYLAVSELSGAAAPVDAGSALRPANVLGGRASTVAGRGRHFQRIAHAIGEAATIPIRSPVCDRREKAVQQKAMRTQQFDQIET